MTDQPTRTLVLLRHAKAADPDASSDHERPLTERGHDDAAAAGEWLKERDLAPTLVLCSTALRTRQTWAAVADASGLGGLVEHSRDIYQASDSQLLDVLRGADHDARVVAMVGHAPGIPQLAVTLDDGEGDPAARAALHEGFPTSTLAVLDVPSEWADLTANTARIRAVHTARAR